MWKITAIIAQKWPTKVALESATKVASKIACVNGFIRVVSHARVTVISTIFEVKILELMLVRST